MRMRSLLCLCLCAALCLPCAAAFAAPGDTVLYPQRAYYDDMEALEAQGEDADSVYLSSVAIQPGAVYTLVNDNLVTRWQPGEEAPTTLFELESNMGYFAAYPSEGEDPPSPEDMEQIAASIHTLVSGDDGLYALNLATLRLARVSDTGYEFLDVDLDMPPMEVQGDDWRNLRSIYNAFVLEGDLFLLLGGESREEWEIRTLYRVPLSGAARQTYEVEGLLCVSPYKDGQLLAGVSNTDGRSYALDLLTLDSKSGKLGKTLKTQALAQGYDPSGFAYAPGEDAVYFLENNQVQRLDLATGEIKGLSYLAASSYGGDTTRIGLLEGGYFALSHFNGIYIRNTDPAYAVGRALRIAGGWEDRAYEKFLREHPEIPVLLLDTEMSGADAIAQAIQGGETEVDLYTVYGYSDLKMLMDKGYAADLTGSQVLTQDVAAMYPQAQAALADEQGVLRAYPMQFYAYPMVVNTTLFEAYFPGRDLPETWADFLGLYLEFVEDPPDDVAFLDYYVERDALVYTLLNQFSRRYEQDGQEADFEHPALREALELVAQLPVHEQMSNWSDMTGDQLAQLNDYYSRLNIFSTESQMFEDLEKKAETPRSLGISSSGGLVHYRNRDAEAASAEETGTVYRLITMPVFEPGQVPMLEGSMPCMVVNPKSSNLDFALTYLEVLSGALDSSTNYALHPDLNEPLRPSYYEYDRKNTQKYIDELREALPDMEAVERKESEAYIADLERMMREDEENAWEITAGAIEDYREVAPYITLRVNGVFDTAGEEGRKQIFDLMEKYTQGQLQLDAFLKELNGKARMIRREQL